MSQQPKFYNLKKPRREKLLKQKKTEQEKSSSTFKTKITDINDDCLEKVFMYLSLDDLINIARTNKPLKPAADMVFQRKYAKKKINLHIVSDPKDGSVLSSPKRKNARLYIIYDFRTSFRLLGFFGHLITELTFGSDTINHNQLPTVRLVP